MNRKQLITALKYHDYKPKVYQETDDKMTVRLTDYIFLNVVEYEEVIVTSRLYAELKVSDSLAHQNTHAMNLIKTIDLMMNLFTNIQDRDNVYNAIDLYNLGNYKKINMNGYEFQCGIENGLLYFEIGELV